MKKILVAIVVSISFLSCKSHSHNWTEAYYNKSYEYIDKIYEPIFKDSNQRKEITRYTINKLKKYLPDGLSSVSNDSLKSLCAKIGKEYAKENKTDKLRATMPWTVEGEKSFKESVLGGNFIKGINKDLRNNYCDCLITQLKYIYPDSLIMPLPDSVYVKIVNECNLKVINNSKQANTH